MTPLNELLEHFRQTLTDGRLSRGEQRALRQSVTELRLSERQLGNLRAKLFALARNTATGANAHRALDWLEAALKTTTAPAAREATAKVFFSPGEQCRRAIKSLLGVARDSIDICVFTITDNEVTDAILRAHERRVPVRVITDNDKAHDAGSDVARLRRAGLSVVTDHTPDHMHHKFAVVDGNTVLTGSYNWTRSAATENFENLLVLDDPRVVRAYAGEFSRLWKTLGGTAAPRRSRSD